MESFFPIHGQKKPLIYGEGEKELPLLSLITFKPTPNFLENVSPLQRKQFFDALRELCSSQSEAEKTRANSILSQKIKLAHPDATSLPESGAQALAHGGKAAPPPVQLLSREVSDFARGDREAAFGAIYDFESRMHSANYKHDDLMALLLLVIEDRNWGGSPGAPGLGSSDSGAPNLPVIRLVPQKLRQTASDSAHVRLASVREMLRYYFLNHPKDYAAVLAAALGLTSDQEEDPAFMQERLASELASIGSFALAQKVLFELKRMKKMRTRQCLLELGYKYDKRKKRLILGKRTCGKPAEAGAIARALLSMLKG